MSYIKDNDEGIYNNARRFAFTNITDSIFTSHWDGQPITVKPKQTVELPHHLADKLTNELVDKIMIDDIKLEETNVGTPYYRSPRGSSLGVPAVRRPIEEKIVKELKVDEESPELQAIRAQIREEVLSDLKKDEKTNPVESTLNSEEFSEIKEK